MPSKQTCSVIKNPAKRKSCENYSSPYKGVAKPKDVLEMGATNNAATIKRGRRR
tara:strand:- start:222 stop:383 length:162 start_codon:yes stop_codon:yes gene_type:complete